MATSSSNAIQRRNALLRAFALIVTLTALTGFTVSRFSMTEYYKNVGTDDDYRKTIDTLRLMAAQRDSLLRLIAPIEEAFRQIAQLDKEYARDSSASLRWKIDPLEKRASVLTGRLKEKNLGGMEQHFASAYEDLLRSRLTIWGLRSLIEPVNPDDDENKGVLLALRTEDIAGELDREARDLENIVIKGWFVNRRALEQKLNQVAQNLRNLAGQVRAI